MVYIDLKAPLRMMNLLFPLVVSGMLFIASLAAGIGDYHQISTLGKGERGEVLLATDQSGKSVAIKKMHSLEQLSSLSFPKEYLEGIFREDGYSYIAEWEYFVARRLAHPSIIKAEDLFMDAESDGIVHTYLIMEYVDGLELQKVVEGSFPKKAALENVLALIDALRHAASKNLAHFDLYSSNIMFDSNQKIKLIDLESFDEIGWIEDLEDYMKSLSHTINHILSTGDFDPEQLEVYSIRLQTVLEDLISSEMLTNNPQPEQQQVILILDSLSKVFTQDSN